MIEAPAFQTRRDTSSADYGPWIPWIGLLLAMWTQLFYSASYGWLYGQYYDYGWYVPPLAVWFFYQKWRGWATVPRPSLPRWVLIGGLLVLGLALASMRTLLRADPAWTTPLWGQAGIVCAATLLIVWRMAGKAAVFGLIPVLLFALTAVRLQGTVERFLVNGLTLGVLDASGFIFRLFGRPVMVVGNQLELMGELVEVTEGCSGVRSIQSFLMVALFLGEWMGLKILPRLAMIGIGLITAWGTNVMRATFLAWIRFDQGQSAFDRYHDTAGMVAYLIGAGVMIWVSAHMDSERKSGRLVRRHPESRVG